MLNRGSGVQPQVMWHGALSLTTSSSLAVEHDEQQPKTNLAKESRRKDPLYDVNEAKIDQQSHREVDDRSRKETRHKAPRGGSAQSFLGQARLASRADVVRNDSSSDCR